MDGFELEVVRRAPLAKATYVLLRFAWDQAFLAQVSQVMSADHSCRAAVARLIVHCLSQGLAACSPRTGAYCQARERLPETFFSAVTCLVGRALESRVDPQWLWKGRRVRAFALFHSTPDNLDVSHLPSVQNPMIQACKVNPA